MMKTVANFLFIVFVGGLLGGHMVYTHMKLKSFEEYQQHVDQFAKSTSEKVVYLLRLHPQNEKEQESPKPAKK